MTIDLDALIPKLVALHPEGVDRNLYKCLSIKQVQTVALHPEGVDRNFEAYCELLRNESRPPPGGRG